MADDYSEFPVVKGIPRPPPFDPDNDPMTIASVVPRPVAMPPALVAQANPQLSPEDAAAIDAQSAAYIPKQPAAPADPYAEFERADAPQNPAAPAAMPQAGAVPPSPADPYSEFTPAPAPVRAPAPVPFSEPEGKTFLKHAALEAVPATVGGGGGAVAGGVAGAALGMGTPASIPLGIVGAGLGAYGGESLVRRSQNAVLRLLPQSWVRKFGIDPATIQKGAELNPKSAIAGDIAPNLLLGRPGLVGETMPQKIAATATAAGVGGGIEAGRELAEGEPLQPKRIAGTAALQAVSQKPGPVGKVIFPAHIFGAPAEPAAPPPETPPPSGPLQLTDQRAGIPMSDLEIAIAKARMNRGSTGGPGPVTAEKTAAPGYDAKAQKTADRRAAKIINAPPPEQGPPGEVFGSEDRAPQTRDDIESQRQAEGAFALAQRQRDRLAAQPETLDTQAAGRPEGVDAQQVHIHEGFPVMVHDRTLMPDANGRVHDIAMVQRFDPRTGQPEEGSIPYAVPAKELKVKNYAVEPRQAQEFMQRAEGPPPPEQPRMPNKPVQREPNQTFRATAPDNNEDFPGAGVGRSPFPEQPEGPGPYKDEAAAETWFRKEQERRARGEQTQAEQEAEAKAQAKYTGGKSSNTTQAKGKDGWPVDEFGYVKSDKGGPVKFSDHMQAAKWIIRKGQKDTDQIFEIANHPDGKGGFTVRMRGRANSGAKPGVNPETSTEKPQANKDNGPPKQLNAPPPPEKEAVSRETPSVEPNNGKQPEEKPVSVQEQRKIVRELQQKVKKMGKPMSKGKKTQLAALKSQLAVENDKLRGMLDQQGIKRGTEANLKKPPLTLAGFIRKNGGIRDDEGELRAMDIHNNRRLRGIMNSKGLSPAQMHAKLVEAGFLPGYQGASFHLGGENKPTESRISDMYDAISEEAHGRPQYNLKKPPNPEDISKKFDEGEDQFDQGKYQANLEDAAKAEKVKLEPDEILRIMKDYRREDPHDALSDYLEDRAREASAAGEFSAGPNEESDIPFPGEASHGTDEKPGTAGNDRPDAGEGGPSGNGSDEKGGAAGGDQRPAGEPAASGAEKPLIDTEEESARTVAKRNAEKRIKGEVPQKSIDDLGLFSESRAKGQRDIFSESPSENQSGRVRSNDAAEGNGSDNGTESNPERNAGSLGAGEEVTPDNVGSIPKGTKLYSGLPLDAISRAIADTAKWTFGEHEDWARNLDGLYQAVKNTGVSESRRKDPIIHFARVLLGSAAADTRSLARQYKSPTYDAQIDHVSELPGSGRAIGEIYDAAVYRNRTQFMNRFQDAFKDIIKNQKLVEQAINQVRSGKIVRETPVGDAATGLRKLLDDVHAYMKDAGVDVGYQKNYFPRSFEHMAIMRNPQGFMKALEAQYLKNGIDPKSAKELAQQTHDEIIFGNNGSMFTGRDTVGKADFVKGRVFGPEVDRPGNPLYNYLVHDPVQSLQGYLFGAVKRAEVARRWGENFSKWDEIEKKITDEGTGAALPELRDLIRQATVMRGSLKGAALHQAEGLIRTWTILARLPHTFRTIVGEPLVAGVRTGNPFNGLKAFGNTLRDLLREDIPTGKGLKDTRHMGEYLGIVGAKMFDQLGMAQWAGGEPVSRLQQAISNRFLHNAGIAQVGESRLVGALSTAQPFLRMQANRVLDGSKLAADELADMGIPREKQQAFAKWMKQFDGMPRVQDLRAGGDMSDMYRTAMHRIVRGMTMMPTPVQRPRWMATNPLGRVMGQLRAYSYSFWEQVWIRSLRLAQRGITGEGYTAADRARMLMPLATLPTVALGQYLIRKASNKVLNSPGPYQEQPEEDQIKHAFLLGAPPAPLEPLIEAEDYMAHGKSPLGAFSGPGVNLLSDVGEASGIGYRLATKNEKPGDPKKAARLFYQDVMVPAANLMLSVAPTSPGSVLATQAISSNRARDKFVNKITGGKPQVEERGSSGVRHNENTVKHKEGR